MIYVRWSISILWIFVGFRSVVIPQWHFEKGNQVKTRWHVSLIYAKGKDGVGAWGKRPVLVYSQSVGGSYESITNFRKPVVTHIVDWLMASYECCTIEGSYPRPLAGRLLHQPPLCGLSLLQQRSKQRKLELCKGLAGCPSEKRAFVDFWTAHVV